MLVGMDSMPGEAPACSADVGTVLAPLLAAVVTAAVERRVLLGISGGPGSGKSTLANQLAEAWNACDARIVPMDGFHFTNAELAARGLASRKGAPDTFDAEALADLLARLRTGGEATAPAYGRKLHEPVPDAIRIPTTCRIVIVEGNYLGLATPPWPRVRAQLDWLWRLDVPWEVTRERLISRRIATGRYPKEARAWVDTVDAANFALVATSEADVVLT
jgi:pantothenate kinase